MVNIPYVEHLGHMDPMGYTGSNIKLDFQGVVLSREPFATPGPNVVALYLQVTPVPTFHGFRCFGPENRKTKKSGAGGIVGMNVIS